jgi:endonuclease/exonuclease/phosphatase family metal-dependent hydrolase
LIGWYFTPAIYKVSDKNSSLNDDLKVMSYNVRMFNYWEWIDDDKILQKTKKLVTKQSPDILLIQECYDFSNFSYPYNYINPTKHNKKVGLAIYSKFPIINKGSLNLIDTSNDIIFADIIRNKDTIRVYNVHLQSLGLKPEKENFGQENSEKIITSLKNGFQKQAEQTTIFLEHQNQWKGKIVLGGDFNNTAYSWVYNQISKNKKDAFIEAGSGFGKTFDYWFPMRIDFILTNENAIINQFTSFSEKNSDHFPIQAKINW